MAQMMIVKRAEILQRNSLKRHFTFTARYEVALMELFLTAPGAFDMVRVMISYLMNKTNEQAVN